MSPAEFDDVVGEALDGVPPELTRLMDNVARLRRGRAAGRTTPTSWGGTTARR